MRKFRVILCLILGLCFYGCGNVKNEGIYYPKVEEKEISERYNPSALYACQLLYDEGKIYTSAYELRGEQRKLFDAENTLGNEIGRVYGNHYLFWSENDEYLEESNCSGTLYQIRGYDTSFRLALCYETVDSMTECSEHIVIFEHLNDITLQNGRKLFEDWLHLSDANALGAYTEQGCTWKKISEKDDWVKDFLEAISNSTFLDISDDEYITASSYQGCSVIFRNSNGLTTDLVVCKEGYAILKPVIGKALIVKVDATVCENLLGQLFSNEM